jgi:hypothetical protein
MNPKPIFFAWTRSFWLGIFPALLTAVDMAFHIFGDPATAGPIAAALAALLSAAALIPGLSWLTVTPEQITATMQAAAPLYALIVGQQRMHAARPYTLDPRARE